MFSKANGLTLGNQLFVLQEACEAPLDEVFSHVYKRKDFALEGAGERLVSSLCYSLEVEFDCELPLLSGAQISGQTVTFFGLPKLSCSYFLA